MKKSMLVLLAAGAAVVANAGTYFVDSAATGAGDGTGWSSPYTLAQAFEAATSEGDEIRLKAGDYAVTAETAIASHPGLTIRGGYTGEGEAREGRSSFVRDSASSSKFRLFKVTSSTIVFDGIGFRNGRLDATGVLGQGVCLQTTCTAAFIDCEFKNNGGYNTSSTQNYTYGGALYADGGVLAITNSVFDTNFIDYSGGGNQRGWGGALYAKSAVVSIYGTRFTKNRNNTVHDRHSGGGAIALDACDNAVIDACRFETNSLFRGSYERDFSNMTAGGTAYVANSVGVTVRDTTVIGGHVQNGNFATSAYRCFGMGQMFYFHNSSAAFVRTVLYNRGYPAKNNYSDLIDFRCDDSATRTLALTNVLFVAGEQGRCLGCYGTNAKIDAVNCTFTGVKAGSDASRIYSAYSQYSGAAKFTNCLFWDNYAGATFVLTGADPTFQNCSLTDDPEWYDTTYCHPVSEAGRYDGGWFTGGTWVTTDTTVSSLIDAGMASMSEGDEPQPNGRRVNIGYDGGSPTASKSVMGSQPIVDSTQLMIYSYPAKDITADGATVCADVASTGGGANPTVTVVWDSSDKGRTSVSAWTHGVELPGTYAPWQLVSYQITGATGSEVYYRFVAHNGEKGDAWSDGVRSFQLAQMPTLADAQVRRTFRTSAQPAATLADDGGSATTVYLVWWATDDPTAKTTNFYNAGESVASETVVSWDLSGLSPNTSYTAQIFAKSSAGEVSLPAQTFVTLSADVGRVFYVGTEETGLGDGSSWANAATFARAFEVATTTGDELRLMAGDYTTESSLSLANHAGFTMRGGYTGDGESRSGRATICRNTLAVAFRLFDVSASTVTFDGIGFQDGTLNASGELGQAVRLRNDCTAVFTNCLFRRNGDGGNSANELTYGGAICANGGTLAVFAGDFEANHIGASYDNGANAKAWGGAIYATKATVTIRDSRFTGNYTGTAHNRLLGGGALALTGCSSVAIEGCVFDGNFSRRNLYTPTLTDTAFGGTAYLQDCPSVVIRDCIVKNGYVENSTLAASDLKYVGTGHDFYLYNTTCSLTRSVFYSRGQAKKGYAGRVDIRNTALAMTNVLMVAGERGWCLGSYDAASTIDAQNCTFTGVKEGDDSTRADSAYAQNAGAATFRNCVFWDNAGGAWKKSTGDDPVLTDTMTATDPEWADNVYCHPVSRAGRYDGGWFTNGTWVTTDAATSPAIDRVVGFAQLATEPQPNGRRVNAGYDGDCEVASKSDLGTNPCFTEGTLAVYCYPDSLAQTDSVILYGDVAALSTGETEATVWLVWDEQDRGTASKENWAHAIACGSHRPWDLVAVDVSGFVGQIFYRFVAQDGKATAWSDPARDYTKAVLPTVAYDTDEHPFTHVSRVASRLHLELVSRGGLDTTVWATIAPKDDPSAAVSVPVSSDPIPVGKYAVDFTGLLPGTEYTVTVTARNGVGDTTLEAKTFTTPATEMKLAICAAPEASGYGDGTSWENKATLADAIAAVVGGVGDTIQLQTGTYSTYGNVLLTLTNLTIRGGYDAAGTPRAGETVLTPEGVVQPSTDKRLFVIRQSTITLDGITFEKGVNSSSDDVYGQAVGVKENSSVSVTNCVFTQNGVSMSPSGDRTTYIGGAIGANSGVLTVVDCTFDGNSLYKSGQNLQPYGGAIGVNGAATVSVKNSTFNRNAVGMVHARVGGGGALAFMGGAQATVENCLFTTNYARTSGGSDVYEPQADYGPWGGTIYTTGEATTLKMQDLKIIGGYAFNGHEVANGRDLGGTFCFNGGAVSGDRIEIADAGANEYADSTKAGKYATGSIAIYAGTVALTNVAHLGAKRGAIVAQQGGTVEFVNGTFAGAEGRQKATAGFPACGYLQRTNGSSGAATFKNCIFWDNKGGFRSMTNDAITVTASYSDLEGEPDAANHVLSVDPKFVGAEKAAKQVKDEGEGVGEGVGEWAATSGAATFLSLQAKTYSLRSVSPCSNAGADVGFTADSVDLLGNPRIRGSRVDMGAFESVQRGLLLIVK